MVNNQLYIASLTPTEQVIPAKAGIQKKTGFRVKPGMTNSTGLMSPRAAIKDFNKSLRMGVCYLLSTVCFLVLLGCQQVQKPEVRGEGPLAVNMTRGLTAPEFHAPLERWRTTHKKALNIGDFTERECILCHDPKKSCNNCHHYIGVREIDVPEASLFWPEEKKEKK